MEGVAEALGDGGVADGLGGWSGWVGVGTGGAVSGGTVASISGGGTVWTTVTVAMTVLGPAAGADGDGPGSGVPRGGRAV
ncbi:hypothetical protein [Actinoplanes flavus]|uniref:Uncharacterized protein n=1 Tax=Actinoplanes flavus TaxID=2820290 RepID=A0ABS3URQ8_9ACTN|nr:hypothetical protein [Actinoplanes flavus]MBO3740597.1 hypothetical protein [Actinoplanes flavus]